MALLSALTKAVDELVQFGYPREVAERIVSGDLPMDTASRMQRAEAMGFDPTDVQYHGTEADITQFRPSAKGKMGPGVYTTPSPSKASVFAGYPSPYAEGGNVMPLLLRGDYIKRADAFDLRPEISGKEGQRILNETLEGMGYAGSKAGERGSLAPEAVTFDPRNVRSLFAAFDPEYKGSNILGGAATAAVGAGLLAAPEEAEAGLLSNLIKAGYPEEVAQRIASGELSMDYASRRQRAIRQGYNPDDIQYHGTYVPDIKEVDPYLVDLGIHTGNPQQAAQRIKNLEQDFGSKTGANVLPLLTKSRNSLEMRDVGDFKNSTQVLEGLVSNPKLANRKSELEDLYEQSDALQAGFQNSEKSFRESSENRKILDEIRAILDQEGFDSIKYQNQVENAYGDLPDLTPQAKQQKIEIGQEITKLESEAMKGRLPAPDPSDPMAEEKIQAFLSASSNPASYMNDKQLIAYESLKDAYRAIGENPNNYMDTSSRITLYPEDVRSLFAAFDPKYTGPNILGGSAAAATGLGLLGIPQESVADTAARLKAESDTSGAYAPRSGLLQDVTMAARDLERRLEGSPASLLFPSGYIQHLEEFNRPYERSTYTGALLGALDFL